MIQWEKATIDQLQQIVCYDDKCPARLIRAAQKELIKRGARHG